MPVVPALRPKANFDAVACAAEYNDLRKGVAAALRGAPATDSTDDAWTSHLAAGLVQYGQLQSPVHDGKLTSTTG